jgi:hypothetical protein
MIKRLITMAARPFRLESGETNGAAGDFAADDANMPGPISEG